MKRIFTAFLFLSIGICLSAEKLPYWKDLKIHTVNTVTPRSAFMSYTNKETALTGKYENSQYWFANVQMFEAAGIALPYEGWTYSEFLEAVEKLTPLWFIK